MRIAIIPLIITALTFCDPKPDDNVIRFAAETTVFEGLGASVYVHDLRNLKAIQRLRLRYVRIEPSPNWAYFASDIPAGTGLPELRSFVRGRFENQWRGFATRFARFHGELKKRDVRSIWVMYQLPFKWLNGAEKNRLRPERRDDLLNLWLAQLIFYKKLGVVPYALEMVNEPDGWWNGRLSAADYHLLVIKFRRMLNEHGFRSVKIGGPGFSSLNLYHDNEEWIADMPDRAFAALDFFTVHAWDEVHNPRAGLNFLRGQWHDFRESIKARDPEHTRRLIMTEYSTEVVHFGERAFYSPRTRALYTAAETSHFGRRVVANSLLHINQGVAVPMIWRLSDDVTDKTSWGLIAAKPRPYKRPAFFHLEKMISSIAPDTRVHQSIGSRNDDASVLLTARGNNFRLRGVNVGARPEIIMFRLPRSKEHCACRLVRELGEPTKARGESPKCEIARAEIFNLKLPAFGAVICDIY